MNKRATFSALVLIVMLLIVGIHAQAVSFNMQDDDSGESGTGGSSEVDTYSNDTYGINLLSDVTVVDSGYCGGTGDGTNLTWTLYSDGLLEIAGTGIMADYNSESYVPWYSYRDSITIVRIENGVTSVGKNAFFNCAYVSNVYIPETMQSMEMYAWNSKTGKKVYIKNIDNWCRIKFGNKDGLAPYSNPLNGSGNAGGDLYLNGELVTRVNVPEGVSKLIDTFDGCNSLEYVHIPSSVKTLGYSVFSGCENLKQVDIENGVEEIGLHAFANCKQLKELTIPNSIIRIDSSTSGSAFYNTLGMTIYLDKAANSIAGKSWGASSATVIWLRDLSIGVQGDQIYTGSKIEPYVVYEVRKDDVSIKDPLQSSLCSSLYTITYGNNINAGTASVKVVLKSNSSVVMNGTFNILPKSCSGLNISEVGDKVFTGSEITPSVTITDTDI